MTVLTAEDMKRLGVAPKAALLSHSCFGSSGHPSAVKMRQALERVRRLAPWLESEGEMHGDAALNGACRREQMPRSTLQGDATLLVLPNIDAANIAYNLLKLALREHFHVPPDSERFRVIHDGAQFVRYYATRPDVLMIDGLDSNGLPAHLCSQHFYDDCHEMLQPGGMVANLHYGHRQYPRHLDRVLLSFGARSWWSMTAN
jgi:hypothetical protein